MAAVGYCKSRVPGLLQKMGAALEEDCGLPKESTLEEDMIAIDSEFSSYSVKSATFWTDLVCKQCPRSAVFGSRI